MWFSDYPLRTRSQERAQTRRMANGSSSSAVDAMVEKVGENKASPSLKGLFQKRRLLNGSPATEQNIRLRIKNGGDGMPSYEQVLSAKELDQLIAYLKKL